MSFADLDLSSSGAVVFPSAGTGAGARRIRLTGCLIHNSRDAGLADQPQDSAHTIRSNSFVDLGDSGLLIEGDDVALAANTITETRENSLIAYGEHGSYDKNPNTTIADNISDDTGGSGISMREHGARIFDNAIHNTAYAISLFPEDPENAGSDAVYYNRMWDITGFAFYDDGTEQVTGAPSRSNVLWSSDTVELSGARQAINLSEVSAAEVVVNNVFSGSYASAYRGCAGCSEFDNDWYGGASNVPDGPGDLDAPPELSAPRWLAPQAESPLVDAGARAGPGTRYAPGCDGMLWHVCGSAPNLGAVEALPVAVTEAHPRRCDMASADRRRC